MIELRLCIVHLRPHIPHHVQKVIQSCKRMGIPEIVRAPYLCKPEVDAKNTFKNVLQPLTKSRFCLELLSLGCLIDPECVCSNCDVLVLVVWTLLLISVQSPVCREHGASLWQNPVASIHLFTCPSTHPAQLLSSCCAPGPVLNLDTGTASWTLLLRKFQFCVTQTKKAVMSFLFSCGGLIF